MKLFLRNYLLFILLSLLTLFSCADKSTTDASNPSKTPSTTSLSINYDISGNVYITLTNGNVLLDQKTNFGGPATFSVNPTLPSGLTLDANSGDISGTTPTTVSLPTAYTITANAGGKNFSKTIFLGVAPSEVWVTNANAANSYQLTAYVVGDGTKQISDWTWSLSDGSLATVTNGVVSFESTTTGGTVVISASKNSYSNSVSFTVNKVEEFNGQKVVTDGGKVELVISNGTETLTHSQFKDKGITSVVIGNGVVSIGNSAFIRNKLTSVSIPDSVTTISGFAFHGNLLGEVSLKQSLYDNLTFFGNTRSRDEAFGT